MMGHGRRSLIFQSLPLWSAALHLSDCDFGHILLLSDTAYLMNEADYPLPVDGMMYFD